VHGLDAGGLAWHAKSGNSNRAPTEARNERISLDTITLTSPLTDPAKNDAEHTRFHGQDSLFKRNPSNPILSGKDWPYPVNSVFNAGVVRLDDGDTLLLCRVEDRRGLSHLCAARSANGIDGWRIDSQPTLEANPHDYPEEIWGIEDRASPTCRS